VNNLANIKFYIKRAYYLPCLVLKSRTSTRCYSSKELVDFTVSGCGGAIRPLQYRSEILSLMDILARRRPRRVLEIGTASGGTLFLFTRVVAPDARLISVDLPKGRFGGGYPFWRTYIYRSFALPGQRINLLRANSHETKTVEAVERILNGDKIDFLFIDGDHSLEGVMKDFELYSPLVADGGMVALHDIVHDPKWTGCEVSVLWADLKSGYEVEELVEDWDQKWGGIGVIPRFSHPESPES
jgi:cephalosporin hydroxylase